MRLIPVIVVCGLSVLWAASENSVCHADDALRSGLLSCAKLGDNMERLACYDRLTEKPPADPGDPSPPPAAAPADLFGSRPRSVPPASPALARTEIKSITAHVIALRERQHGSVLLTLDNGQEWQQLGTEDLLLKVGDGVKISRGMFDSFILMTDGNRVTHVKRIE